MFLHKKSKKWVRLLTFLISMYILIFTSSRYFVCFESYHSTLFHQLSIDNCVDLKIYSLKGGDPAAPSDTATLLRLHPSHQFYLRQLPPIARLDH